MSQAKPSSPLTPAAGDDRNLVAVDANYLAPSFEDRLQLLWAKYNRAIILGIAAVVLGFVAKGVIDTLAAQREEGVAKAFAAATDDAGLRTFITANPTHALAGVAELQLADKAYGAGKYGEAQTGYTKAVALLAKHPFGQRAQIGAAVSQVLAGKATEGEAALKQLMTNMALDKSFRAEAGYHCAVLALSAGRFDDASALLDQIFSIDPSSQWTQRSFSLRTQLPPKAAEPAKPAPEVSKEAAKK